MISALRSVPRPFRNAIACRQSYIEISNYVQGIHIPRHSSIKCSSIRKNQFHSSSRLAQDAPSSTQFLDDFKNSLSFPPSTLSFEALPKEVDTGRTVVLHGYVGKRIKMGKQMFFVRLADPSLKSQVQMTVFSDSEAFEKVKTIESHSSVAIRGTVKKKDARPQQQGSQEATKADPLSEIEVVLEDIQCLNTFPKDIVMKPETVFPMKHRHLQLRNYPYLRNAINFRAKANMTLRKELEQLEPPFVEVETPLLFKSTPEGAREFLVPTRNKGMAYALPQSPQQYKQMLMAGGITRYYQFARCFRDEDLRADRQPEFTQLDLEMSFATAEDVMSTIESLVRKLWASLMETPLGPEPISRMTYQDAMAKYGSDKPDTRLGMEITRVEYMVPVEFVSMISPLSLPAVEAFKLSGSEEGPSETRKLLKKFMESPAAAPFVNNPDGAPATLIYNSRQAMSGLSSLGFEAASVIEEDLSLEDGDLLILQARKNEPFSGGSTAIGELRLALHKFAVEQEFTPPPTGYNFHWITNFPLFSPVTSSEPGQGGTAGIASTHHPFTAPRTAEDVSLLLTEPTKAIADHYDLVLNGIELGGGSRRIHSAAVQEFILRDVLKLPPSRLEDFSHLLEALRAGCPPHAGIALGFDRLVAVMLGRESVRDVIAFPKTGKGEDVMVQSPSLMTEESLQTYHLQVREGEDS